MELSLSCIKFSAFSTRFLPLPHLQKPQVLIRYHNSPNSLIYSIHSPHSPQFLTHCAPNNETASTTVAERWLLEPIGDGDSKHIGYEVAMPGSFEVASSAVTVGRVPEMADVVLPVATVSGRHAMLQKRGGLLFVTDLDSTNGTYLDEVRLRPGANAVVENGSCIIFGDMHLAMFRVKRVVGVDDSKEVE